jgi:hypothetical protein
MSRALRTTIYYAIFLAASVAVHAVVILGPRRMPTRQEVKDFVKEVDLQLAALQPPPPPPTPGEPPKFKEAPKKEETQPEPEPPKKEEAPKEETKPEPAPKEPEPAKEEKKPEPAKAPEARPAIASLDQYRKFLARSMPADASDRTYVPKIRFGDNSDKENREIMRYFGMELIAYPKGQDYYVYIDPEQNLYSKSSEFGYLKNFSNRVIFRSSPYFDAIRREAAKRVGVSEEELSVAQLMKAGSALYLAWKENEAAKAAGVGIEQVAEFEASFVRTPFGAWIVRLDRLTTTEGRVVAIDDFEWRQMTEPKGGGR